MPKAVEAREIANLNGLLHRQWGNHVEIKGEK